jgi:putative membrane protein
MNLADLPHFNAVMNLLTIAFLVLARSAARKHDRKLHARWIGAALTSSGIFLASYLVYHYSAGIQVRYDGIGWARNLYLLLLGSHTVLAAFVPIGASYAVFLAMRERVQAHRALVKYLWPIWMYVSLTGIMVYAILVDQY